MAEEATGLASPPWYRRWNGLPSWLERAANRPRSSRRAHAKRRSWFRRWARRVGAVLAAFALLVVALGAVSVVGALRRPGNESFSAKWADWVRDHGGAGIVTPIENWWYEHHEPPRGGVPHALNFIPATAPTTSTSITSTTVLANPHLAPPPNIAGVVQPPLDGEGVWQPTGPVVDGAPGMYVAQFRADDVYTSQLTSAVWMDPSRLRLRFVAGANEPGGQWSMAPAIVGADLARIVAAFNGGFRFKDARGGCYLDHTQAVPLQDGAASIAITSTGHVGLGVWGRDVGMAPDTEAVLQNLTLLVDGGQIDPSVSHDDTRAWGYTLKGNIAVARSGIGVTADGALLYVAGPALTAKTLAESLQRAGAVRAMTLDLNPEWVTFNFYVHTDPNDPLAVQGEKLYPDMQRSANRYLDTDSRDFFTISTN